MDVLIHKDILLEAILREEPQVKNVLDLSRRQLIRLWVLPSTLFEVRKLVTSEDPSVLSRLKLWLNELVILPITGRETKTALIQAKGEMDDEIGKEVLKSFNLSGVLTLNPDIFAEQKMKAWRPEALPEVLSTSGLKTVPLVSPAASYHEIWEDLEKAFAEVIRPGRFILGDMVRRLEEQVAAYCQTAFAVGVSSGTDALLISLLSEGIGSGDEVLTTPFTFFATAGSIARTGATPVFVDIEPETFNMDPEGLSNKITSKTKAIIPVHLYGQCSDMDPILEVANKNGLVVIEDAAQAIGSEYKFKRAGSFGRYGCFSFFPTKNLGGFGDGGIVTTSSEEVVRTLRLLRVHGSKTKYEHDLIGGNFRLDEIQAAAVSVKMKHLEGWSGKRRENAERYRQLFEVRGLLNRIRTPREIFPRHIYNQFVIRVPGCRDDLMAFLRSCGIASEIYYPIPLHRQKCFAYLGYREGDFPQSEQVAKDTLALPISHEVTTEQQSKVVEGIAKFFA